MYVLIKGKDIVGSSDTKDGLPKGYKAVKYEGNKPLEGLYLDGKNIAEKPNRPSLTALWDGSKWVEPGSPVIIRPRPTMERLFNV